MADQALDPFVGQMIQFLRKGPSLLPGFKIPEMELPVRFELNGFVRGMHKRQNGPGGHIVDDVSRGHGVGCFTHGADIAGQVDIGNDSLAPMEPDGHEELHVPAFPVTSVLMDFIQAVTPILSFQKTAFIMTECPAQLMAGRIQQPDIESLPHPFPSRPRTKVPVHHAEIVRTVSPPLRIDVHAANGTYGRIVFISVQQLLGKGEEIRVRDRIILKHDTGLNMVEKP